MTKKNEIHIHFTEKQWDAWTPLIDEKNQSVLYGGAKGGGKSFLMCIWVRYWAMKLIEILQIDKADMPIPVGFIGRKQSVDFSKTTLETFKKVIPAQAYRIREQEKEIIILDKKGYGRVKIFYGGLDDKNNINKFNSAELAFIAIDQAEETERKDVSVLEASLRLTHNGIKPPYKIFYTANPAECWLKHDFVNGERAGSIYVPALPSDNPHLPGDYIETLKRSFSHDPVLLDAYMNGKWDVMVLDNIVIPSRYITDLQKSIPLPMYEKKVIACDPATGGDECVVYVMENYKVIDQKILHYDDVMKTVGELMLLSKLHNCHVFAIDGIGIGNGVVGRLREMGMHVRDIISSEKANNEDMFYNRRAEMWWKVRELMVSREIPYMEDEELRRQLSSTRYSIPDSNGRIKLEPKDRTKDRIGRSPDRADAFVYGAYVTASLKKQKKADHYDDDYQEVERNYRKVRGGY